MSNQQDQNLGFSAIQFLVLKENGGKEKKDLGPSGSDETMQQDLRLMPLARKLKDAELPSSISFHLNPVNIGIVDHKGRSINSAVLELTSCIDTELEKIKTLIPDEGINQRDLIAKIKTELRLSKAKAQELLDAGLTIHWSTEKGRNNATIYKLFSGFPSYKDEETEKPME